MSRVVSIVGARPQFIKAAAVSRVLRGVPGTAEVLLHTGQHYDDDMSAVFFRELEIPEADYNLGIGSGTHAVQTARMLETIEAVLVKEAPEWVLVYGDTNSTLAGALAAAKLRLPLAHVEAGLRSFNRAMPEEINRVVADHVSDLLFAPTPLAAGNLAREGIAGDEVALVGDVMYDAMLHYARKAESQSTALARLGLAPGQYVLATIHRAENTDQPARLAAIFAALAALARELAVVVPLHPRTGHALARTGLSLDAAPGLRIIGPIGYLDMVTLERHARLIATDSGGVQKEAYFNRVPCVTLRTETEWVELVDAGWNVLAPPTDAGAVQAAVRRALDAKPPAWRPLYGDGTAARAIVDRLLGAGATPVREG
jgi:UDP-GlcNAc3NAcA epimerase